MYNNSDLDKAVNAGVLSQHNVDDFRLFYAKQLAENSQTHRTSPPENLNIDEENFRLITGFNDVFVVISSSLLLGAIYWLSSLIHPFTAGIFCALSAWGLAEYFTRIRKMALPSILLLFSFIGFLAISLISIFEQTQLSSSSVTIIISAILAVATYAHWRRFRVAITIAAIAGTVIMLGVGLVNSVFPNQETILIGAVFLAGLGTFVVAMIWDSGDTQRQSNKSDTAFWLHLLASPLLVHPIFYMLGIFDHGIALWQMFAVAAIYLIIAILSLTIDRRAMMVSGLGYVLYVIAEMFKNFGSVDVNFALAAFFIGGGLLLLSVFWHRVRAQVLKIYPEKFLRKLPVLN